jgi:hypothetical protein
MSTKEHCVPANWATEPMRWRVRGKASDGLLVTLGRFLTEEEARADCEKLTKEGAYRDIRVDPIEPPIRPAASAAGT